MDYNHDQVRYYVCRISLTAKEIVKLRQILICEICAFYFLNEERGSLDFANIRGKLIIIFCLTESSNLIICFTFCECVFSYREMVSTRFPYQNGIPLITDYIGTSQ